MGENLSSTVFIFNRHQSISTLLPTLLSCYGMTVNRFFSTNIKQYIIPKQNEEKQNLTSDSSGPIKVMKQT